MCNFWWIYYIFANPNLRCDGTDFIFNSVYLSKGISSNYFLFIYMCCVKNVGRVFLYTYIFIAEKKENRFCPLDDNRLPVLERSIKSVHFITCLYTWCRWYLQSEEWWHLWKKDGLATDQILTLEDILPSWAPYRLYPDFLNSISVPILFCTTGMQSSKEA